MTRTERVSLRKSFPKRNYLLQSWLPHCVDTMLSLSRSGVAVDSLKDDALREMFVALNEGRVCQGSDSDRYQRDGN